MADILNELDTIFKLISSVPVAGDYVDVMAAARCKMRNLHAELKEMEGEHADGAET